jgi:glycerol-3-phosphate acyltransferase PlsY
VVPVLAFFLLTYLAAGVPFALVATTLAGGAIDVRTSGSGNPGATNVARLYGWRLGGLVMAADICKGLVPTALARVLWPDADPWLGGCIAVVAFLAHVFPIYLEFRGGKGVATAAGALVALTPVPTAIAAGVWALTLLISRKGSVAALIAAAVMVGATAWWQPGFLPLVLGIALAIGVTHTPNLRRLWRGTEDTVVRAPRWSRTPSATAADVLAEGPAGPAVSAPSAWRDDEPAPAPART